MVCVYHFGPELFRNQFPIFDTLPANVLLNGPFAVCLFFVLSGFVLTYGGWRAPKAWAWRQLGKRYPRLAIPIAATTAIIFTLMVLGLTHNREAGLSLNGSRIDGMIDFAPTLDTALSYATFWVFTPRGEFSYHPFLWTMPFEMYGSAVVLVVCLCERGGWIPYVVLVALVAVFALLYPVGATFPAGAMLALAKKDGLVPDLGRLAWPAIALGLIVAAIGNNGLVTPWAVVAAVLCLSAAMSTGARPFFDSRMSQLLGRLSFPLYLMQFPVLVTLTSAMILGLPLEAWYAGLICVASIAATFAVAWAFLPVERFAVWASNALVSRPRRVAA